LGAFAETGNSARRAAAKFPQLILDPPDIALDRCKIVVKYSSDGGYFCVGLGAAAEFLSAVDEDEALARRIDEMADEGFEADDSPLAESADPSLRRLALAMALAKDGFDPDEPRNEGGRWTNGGTGAAAATMAGAGASDIFTPAALVPGLRQIAVRVLSAGAAAPVASFGMLFIPTNRSLISEGAVPDAPDVSYHFDQGTGVLTLTRERADGGKNLLFSGQHGAGGLFRDSDGNVVGRDLGGKVVIDPDTIPGYRSSAAAGTASRAAAGAVDDAAADREEPKLCPDPSTESVVGRKPRGLAYQQQITGLPPGFAFKLVNPVTGRKVSYDGCEPEKNGNMEEAKGPGYVARMIDPNNWQNWYRGLQSIKDQMNRQSKAARWRMVEWHFAERQVADYFARYARANFSNIIVEWTPARMQ